MALASKMPAFREAANDLITKEVEEHRIVNVLQRDLFRQLKAHIKVSHIAAKTGLSGGTVSRLAYGETRFPRYNTILVIARYLGYKFVMRSL